MTRGATTACLLLLGLGGAAEAADLVVTEVRDRPAAPFDGSLRAALAVARPGDVVRFAAAEPVVVAEDLAVPARVAIIGPAALAGGRASTGALVVNRDAVHLEGLGVTDARVRGIVVSGRAAVVSGNVVRGVGTGIYAVGDDDPATDVVVEGNAVSGASGYGLSIDAGLAGTVRVASNAARGSGPARGKETSGLVLASRGGTVEAVSNTVRRSAVFGVQVYATGGTIRLEGSAVTGRGGDGILVHPGAGLLRAIDNAVTSNGGAGVRFRAGSRAELALGDGLVAGNRGGDVAIEEGAVTVPE